MARCPDEALSIRASKILTLGNDSREMSISGLKVRDYVFACCGAGEMSGMGSTLSASNVDLDRAKQDFLSSILRFTGLYKAYYFIITNSQKRDYGNYEKSIYKLLMDTGARQIDDTLNPAHGPNRMLLHIWNPKDNLELLKQYVEFAETGFNPQLGYTDRALNPKWFADLNEADRKALFEKYPASTSTDYYADMRRLQEEEKARIRQERASTIRYAIAYNPDLIKELGLSVNVVTPQVDLKNFPITPEPIKSW